MTSAATQDGPSVGAPPRRQDQARRVADVLRHEVRRGAVPTGLLPAEDRLAQEYGVSRNALRAALDLLRRQGLIERIPGTGTRACGTVLSHDIDGLRGLAETFEGRGEVRNEVLMRGFVPAPTPVAERLELEPGSEVACIERRRLVDEQPVSVDLTFVVPDLGRTLIEADLAGRDVFALLEEIAGVPLGVADLAIESCTADAAHAELLDIAVGAPVLAVERLTRLNDGRPVDLEYIHLRGDRITLRSTAVRPDPAHTHTEDRA
jgi:GntR family transcriptional regulator